jgi:hypothetical protein
MMMLIISLVWPTWAVGALCRCARRIHINRMIHIIHMVNHIIHMVNHIIHMVNHTVNHIIHMVNHIITW